MGIRLAAQDDPGASILEGCRNGDPESCSAPLAHRFHKTIGAELEDGGHGCVATTITRVGARSTKGQAPYGSMTNAASTDDPRLSATGPQLCPEKRRKSAELAEKSAEVGGISIK